MPVKNRIGLCSMRIMSVFLFLKHIHVNSNTSTTPEHQRYKLFGIVCACVYKSVSTLGRFISGKYS